MISIVIPVFNEGENIAVVLGEIRDKVKTPHKIYIVYDFDADSTIPAVNNFLGSHPGFPLELVKNRFGKSTVSAVRTGFSVSPDESEACVVVMGDASDQIELVDQMYAEGFDVVCASRYVVGGEQIGGPRFKKFLSKLAGQSLYVFGLPTHDATNSFRLYSRAVVKNIPIQSQKGFEFTLELTVKSHIAGYTITEIPTVWKDRERGKSNFKLFNWMPRYIYWYFWFVGKKFLNYFRYKQ